MNEEWLKVTVDSPCLKCGRTDGCSINISANKGICRRKNCGQQKIDKNGSTYWVFPIEEISLPELSVESTTIEERDVFYNTLLDFLSLNKEHRNNLRNRSLTDIRINEAKYRSLPQLGRSTIAKKLVEKFGTDFCFRMPGLAKRKNSNGDEYLTLGGASGILIPARNETGKINGLCIRLDTTEKNKYIWLSSKKDKGAGPELITHIPLGVTPLDHTVRLTEGVLKADVAFAISNFPTIGMPGITNWETSLLVLKALDVKKVIFSPDSDFREKQQVATPSRNCIEKLLSLGYEIELEVWS